MDTVLTLLLIVYFQFSDAELVKLAFGSCWHQNLTRFSTPVFDSIAKERATTFVWLGDAIYGDEMVYLKFRPTSPENMKRLYQYQLSDKAYQAMLRSLQTPVIGVYDDHDIGLNNADGTFADKVAGQQLFLDFLGVDEAHPLRKQEGLYAAHEFGEGRVLLLLLDIRYHADKTTGDILGTKQWKFVEETLDKKHYELILVASSIQVLPGIERLGLESWSDWPLSRVRLITLLAKQSAQVVMLSGDVHFGEMACTSVEGARFPIIEATSSGISHAWGEPDSPTPTRHTYENIDMPDSLFNPRSWIIRISHIVKLLMRPIPSRYTVGPHSYFYASLGDGMLNALNYGVVEYDTDTKQLNVVVKDGKGTARLQYDKSQKCATFDLAYERRVEVVVHALLWSPFVILGLLIARAVYRRLVNGPQHKRNKRKSD